MGTAVLPLVRRVPSEAVRPDGEPLDRLWSLFFEHKAAFASLDAQKNYARTRALMASCPSHPNTADVLVWATGLRRLGYAATTVQLHFDNAHSLYSFAHQCGWASCNPFAAAKAAGIMPKAKSNRQAIRDIARTWPFLEAVAGKGKRGDGEWTLREAAFLAVLRYGGLRKAEALALTRQDIETDAMGGRWLLHVMGQRKASELARVPYLKTDASLRRLPMRDHLRAALAPVLALPDAQIKVGRGGGEVEASPFLFPFRANDLEDLLSRLRAVDPAAFPEGDAWHVFRHSCAVELDACHWTAQQIREWLGHASVAKTETYLRSLVGNRVASYGMDALEAREAAARPKAASMKVRGRPRRKEKESGTGSAPTLPIPEPKPPMK